jgi:hypothetical protein
MLGGGALDCFDNDLFGFFGSGQPALPPSRFSHMIPALVSASAFNASMSCSRA